ncbi:MAG: hypothetical protein GQ527_00410 [Bacteroidales bacterium]|nr:hypothetical protein [Bacteroidales bacterium]
MLINTKWIGTKIKVVIFPSSPFLSLNKNIMKNMTIKKWIAIIIMVIGVIGFIYHSEKKSDTLLFSKNIYVSDLQNIDIQLTANHNYKFNFWGTDEEMTGTFSMPTFTATLLLTDSKKDIIFQEQIESYNPKEMGGKLVAHAETTFEYHPSQDEQLELQVQILDGDTLDIDVYQDLSDEGDAMPGIFIIIAIIGLVIFLRARKS